MIMYGLLGSCCMPARMIESACLVASGSRVSSSIHLVCGVWGVWGVWGVCVLGRLREQGVLINPPGVVWGVWGDGRRTSGMRSVTCEIEMAGPPRITKQVSLSSPPWGSDKTVPRPSAFTCHEDLTFCRISR